MGQPVLEVGQGKQAAPTHVTAPSPPVLPALPVD